MWQNHFQMQHITQNNRAGGSVYFLKHKHTSLKSVKKKKKSLVYYTPATKPDAIYPISYNLF